MFYAHYKLSPAYLLTIGGFGNVREFSPSRIVFEEGDGGRQCCSERT